MLFLTNPPKLFPGSISKHARLEITILGGMPLRSNLRVGYVYGGF
jgi:hypothetical protein